MKTNTQALLYFIAYLALFGTWAAIIFSEHYHSTGAESLVQYIQITLGSLTGHVLTMIQPAPSTATPAPANPQSGKSDPTLLMILSAMAALALVGCAGVQQVVSGYEASAVKGLRAAEDNNIQVWEFNVCATPFSAAVRHPEIIAAMRALCLPNGAAGSPAALLDAVPVSK